MAAYVTSERAQRRAPLGAIFLGAVALFSITACGKLGLGSSSDEMSWARAALERNDRVEVVAVDPATNTFTVRIKETGDLRMVRADQVIAGPPGAPVSSAGTPAGPAALPTASTPQSDSSQAASGGAGATAGASAPAGANSMASAGQSAATAGQPAPSPAQDGAQVADSDSASSAAPAGSQRMMRQSNAMASAPRTGFQGDPAPASEVPNPNSDVASITPGGRTLESGPGYAIKTASKGASATATPTARVERERSSTTSSAVERRHDPIVCQGDRFLQIDNRNLEFDGDAVTAEDGCEIHITNSHITAKGVGIFARSANVHIDNSQIEGDSASIDASDGAQVYVSSSRFKGISRRVDSSAFHDLGGNVWN